MVTKCRYQTVYMGGPKFPYVCSDRLEGPRSHYHKYQDIPLSQGVARDTSFRRHVTSTSKIQHGSGRYLQF